MSLGTLLVQTRQGVVFGSLEAGPSCLPLPRDIKERGMAVLEPRRELALDQEQEREGEAASEVGEGTQPGLPEQQEAPAS